MNKKQRLFEVMQKVDNSFKPNLNENDNIFDKFTMIVNEPNYNGTIKRSRLGWQLFDANGNKEGTEPFEDLLDLLNYYEIDKSQLSGEYVNNIPTSPNNIEEMGRPSASAINPKYTHFAVLKDSNKIVNGWDYNGHEQSELKQFKKDYFINDIIDMDINPKLVNIYTKNKLMQIGLNPFDSNNWYKFEAEDWRDKNELNEKSSIPFHELVIDIDNNEGFLVNDENKYNNLLKYGKVITTENEPYDVFGRLWYIWLEIPHNIAEMI